MKASGGATGQSTGAGGASYGGSTMGDAMTTRFTFRLTPEQHEKLKKVAEAERRDAGDWLRLMIDDRHAELVKAKRIKK